MTALDVRGAANDATPANNAKYDFVVVKNNSPGSILYFVGFSYKLIVT